ncbi:radical SAM protein [Streptomyces sp. V2]|uniref:Radical SAM protein n=1 Tax=Streptomyces niveiscabiei TaxID=164115 RepID=A0ABW9HTS7_9ACTN|nr:radical SAM protein [Streptomyces sp. V2]PWG08875.1 radical SAM protein [Streptomyces sp. V2]
MFPAQLPLRFAWLEITGLCNLNCRHCYAESSPQGDHGDMTETDWIRVIDQLDEMGVRDIQFIGGEPTLHPGLSRFIRHAGKYGMRIEVFSNMTHIKPEVWDALQLPGVRLAFSYYSDEASGHEAVTGTRGSHVGTRTNVQRARELGIEMRGSIIDVREGQRGQQAEKELLRLGIRDVRTDRIRPFGRGADGKPPRFEELCGMCGRAKFAVLPDGRVTPCVFSRWMEIGNVHRQTLAEIYSSEAMNAARSDLEREFPHTAPHMAPTCLPECNPSFDSCSPQTVCAPDAACGPTGSGDDDGGSGSLPRTDC